MNTVFEEIGAADNQTQVNSTNGYNSDIISSIHQNFKAAVKETKGIAFNFLGINKKETALNLWNFLKREITYRADKAEVQQIRLPKRFLADKTGDCKSYSLFTAAVLHNLGMPVIFRYVSFTHSKTPTHVYVLTQDENQNIIIVDGVWKRFNDEKSFTHKYDYKMRIETLSGVGDAPVSGKLKQKLKDIWNKAKGAIKTVSPIHVLGRNAFLGLVKLNVRGFATRLSASMAKNPANAKNVWAGTLGGDYNSLTNAVNVGKTKKAILPKKGVSQINGVEISGIGEPVSLTTALVSAAPVILIVVSKILKATGHGDDPLMNDAISDANSAMDLELDEDEIKNHPNSKPNSTTNLTVGSFLPAWVDIASPLTWLNIVIKGSIITKATEILISQFL